MNLAQQYHQQGFCTLEGFWSPTEIKALTDLVSFFQEAPEQALRWMKYYEDIANCRVLNRVENFVPYATDFAIESLIAKMQDLLLAVTGVQHLLFKDKINYKMPGAKGFQPHQDAAAFTRFTSTPLSTIMIAVDACNDTNGCFEVYKNYRSGDIAEHKQGNLGHLALDQSLWQKVPMQPGDLLCFDGSLIHKSEPNRSGSPRRAFFLTFTRSELGDLRQDYWAFKRVSFPPEIERGDDQAYAPWKQQLSCQIR